jgi:hypothetical protein
MSLFRYALKEYLALVASLVLAIAVAALFSPKSVYFAGNFVLFLTPLATTWVILAAMGSRPAFLTGAGLVLALFLAIFGAWELPTIHEFAWLYYLISTPGAIIGAIVGEQIVRGRQTERAMMIGVIGAITTLVGLLINQMLVKITFGG